MFDWPDVTKTIIGYGPPGLIIVILLWVIRYIFQRWDKDRERLIQVGEKHAELAWACAKALEVANSNSMAMTAAVETYKLLMNADRGRA